MSKIRTDAEMLDWLAMQCFYPNDHPNHQIVVLVPEDFAANGSFTMNQENDRIVLRAAIVKAMELECVEVR